MTGTSLDGIDVVIAEFSIDGTGHHNFKMIKHHSEDYPEVLNKIGSSIISLKSNIRDIAKFHHFLPYFYDKAIRQACNEAGIQTNTLDLVGSHGQTAWHAPDPELIDGFNIASTMQLGSPSVLAKLLGVPVVGDFRSGDIALNGQGAPLIPILDFEFFTSENESRILLNIGGIANITYLPMACQIDKVKAFDTGPGNALIDAAAKNYFDQNYDDDGKLARQGKVNNELFEILKNSGYIFNKPPKSTGKEFFNFQFISDNVRKINSSEPTYFDILATLTNFTAWSIAENIRLFADPKAKIIVSGGGIYNSFLMDCLRKELPLTKVDIIDNYGVSSKAKEALGFAYLAYRTFAGMHGNIPSATGADRETILGVIALP
jgi:anhydro-N-acetylmuramic acid kinase